MVGEVRNGGDLYFDSTVVKRRPVVDGRGLTRRVKVRVKGGYGKRMVSVLREKIEPNVSSGGSRSG